jgi:putative tricarboxylic transport membrane protein
VSDNTTQGGRRLDRAALVIAILLAALAIVVAVDTYNLQQGVATYSRIGPRAFPYTIAACLALLAAATAVAAWRGDFPAARAATTTGRWHGSSAASSSSWR